MREIIITKSQEQQRLNKFLGKYLNTAPQSFIYKMLCKKNIKLNGIKADGSEILKENDLVEVFLSEVTIAKFTEEKFVNPYAKKLDIIFEDENIVVINKPIGVLSHPSDPGDRDTIVDRLNLYLSKERQKTYDAMTKPAIVNRLDRNTSGIIVCGKNLRAIQILNDIIKNQDLHKYYLTIVQGKLLEEALVRNYHTKDEKTNKAKITKWQHDESFKEIQTHFSPLEHNKGYTLLEVQLITGKTHQIRAVLKNLGHPIVGDPKYKTNKVDRLQLKHQLLHASRIHFHKAYGELQYLEGKKFNAPLPKQFLKIKELLF